MKTVQWSPSHRFPWRLFRRFLGAQLAVTIAVVFVAGVSTRSLFRSWFVRQAGFQAQATLSALGSDLGGDLSRWCASHSAGSVTFAIMQDSGVSVCSTIPVERELPDPGYFLTAALALPEKKLTLRISFPMGQLREALVYFDRSFPLILLGIAALFLLFSAWLGRRFMFPLARLLVKARQALGGQEAEVDFEGADEEENEWSDLETTLDQIRWNLKSKTETLGREREELATLMSAISDAIVAVDRVSKPLFYNSRFALSFGDRELAEGKRSLADLFRAPEVLTAFRKCLELGRQREVNVQLSTRSEPQAPRSFRLSVNPLRRDGEVYGAVGIFYDVTELKRAEQIRIDFVANVSHELRTPLTSIKGFADTLRGDLARGEWAESALFLEKIGRNVDRLMALVGDLLDLSSLDSGSEMQKSALSVRELTQRVLASVEPLRASKMHHIETSFDVEQVFAQPSRVEQVLTNLIENAIKYMPPAGRISVKWEKNSKGGVILRVADTGPGIPPEHQPRLFERFYRVDKGRSREMGGTGLGLAIVKHIMQVHGGSVYVSSEVGRGAEFVCQFPASTSA